MRRRRLPDRANPCGSRLRRDELLRPLGPVRREQEDFGTFGTRVRPDGTVLDPNGIEIIDACRDLAEDRLRRRGLSRSSSATFTVVSRATFRRARDARRSRPRSGRIHDLSRAGLADTPPTSPSTGRISWSSRRTSGPAIPDSDVYGSRVSPGGTVLDPDGIPVSTAPSGQVQPSLAIRRRQLPCLLARLAFRIGGHLRSARQSSGHGPRPRRDRDLYSARFAVRAQGRLRRRELLRRLDGLGL